MVYQNKINGSLYNSINYLRLPYVSRRTKLHISFSYFWITCTRRTKLHQFHIISFRIRFAAHNLLKLQTLKFKQFKQVLSSIQPQLVSFTKSRYTLAILQVLTLFTKNANIPPKFLAILLTINSELHQCIPQVQSKSLIKPYLLRNSLKPLTRLTHSPHLAQIFPSSPEMLVYFAVFDLLDQPL